MAKSTAMPTNRTPKPTETRLSVPIAAAANSSVEHQPQHQRAQDRHDQSPAPHRQQQPERDQHHAADQAGDGALCDGRELRVRQGDRTGDAHLGRAASHEFQLGRGRAHRLRRRAAGLQRAEILLGLRQDETVMAAEITHLAAQQPLPGQRLRGWPAMRRRHGGVEVFSCPR